MQRQTYSTGQRFQCYNNIIKIKTHNTWLKRGYKSNLGVTKVKISKILACKIKNILLPINFSICFGCSKEPSHWEGSFEYGTHNIYFG